jgi:hypothetical protein
MARDRRLLQRTAHDSVLELLDGSGRVRESVARLSDVSASGASFAGTLTLKTGDRVRARLRLLGQEPFEFTARVVWVKAGTNATRYGLEFEPARRAG